MTIMRKIKDKQLELKKISFKLKHSIIRKLLIIIFSMYLILTFIVTIIHMKVEYSEAKKQTIASLENIRTMTHDSLSQAIWEFNVNQIDAILIGMYANKFIVGLQLDIASNSAIPELSNKAMGLVEDENEHLVYINPKTKQPEAVNNSFERLIPYSFEIYHIDSMHKKQIIGHMYLYSSNKVVFNQVKSSYILLIVNAFIKTLALWIFFLWGGYQYISKPLGRLTEAIKKLSSGNWNTIIDDKSMRSKHKTEINTLIDSFNDMIYKLHSTQAKLEDSRNQLDNIFNTMPSALIFIDQDYVIRGWNKYIVQITGIDASAAIGQKLDTTYLAFNDYLYLIQNAITQHKEQQVKNAKLITTQADAVKLFDIVVYPIKTSTSYEAVIRIDDVTEEVKRESDLAQVEKLASVGASIAGVAHEINNPLGAIMQSMQNVMRRIDPELEANRKVAQDLGINLNQQHKYLEQREIIKFLQNMQEAGERASNIVKNMLNFTRRSSSEMTNNNVIELINTGLQLAATDYSLQEHADFKKIKVSKNYCADNISVVCHPIEIQQVILNIVKNAAQAFPEQQKDKQISVSVSKVEDAKIKIEIADNGAGMTEEIKSKIFQPFFTTKPVGQGTGLGLSVCKNIIVQKHRGSMEVESSVGKGTTFILILSTDLEAI